jgi:hypothetical protein
MALKKTAGEGSADVDVEAHDCMYLEDSSDADLNFDQDPIRTEKNGARTFYFQ